MSDPLTAASLAEVETYLQVHPCPACQQGPWRAELPEAMSGVDPRLTVPARCLHCGREQALQFVVRNPQIRPDDPTAPINPDPEPSRIVDLAQWLGLFQTYLEQASRHPDKGQARWLGYRAKLCLGEALKFYDDDDQLPAESAFFSDASRQAYRRHTERFARQRLRDLQARLPSLETMQSRLNLDQRPRPRRRWWQLWRR